jgi:large subunit ribosomal protein L13e
MPKGNNAVPHVHQRKHWTPCSSQRGNIKVNLDQPKQKERRRRLRIAKAKKVFPRPLKMLRPTVTCPTVRYNMKQRLGRGFTIEELAGAEIKPRFAATIGIRVDKRRKNVSEESLNTNVQRLKTYMSKLVLFPMTKKGAKKGDASEAETKNVQQDTSRWGTATVPHPNDVVKAAEAMRKVTSEESKTNVYAFLKKNHSAVRFLGQRMAKAAAKEAKKEKK